MTGANRGDRLAGRYVLVRRLESPSAPLRTSGTRAQAWVAERDDGVRVVLKLHPAAGAARRELDALAAFELAAAGDPPALRGLVRALEAVDLDDGRSALVLEWLPGGELGTRRGRRWTDTVPRLLPALRALALAHAAGRAHGDLKSANLVLGEDGDARLVDFGTAAFGHPPGRPGGSPYTRSPAQWDGAVATPADDAWALGATLHELLAGHPPFYPQVDRERVANEPVATLHARHPVPAELAALVLELLAKAPAARPGLATAVAVLERLVAAAATEVVDSGTVVAPVATPPAAASLSPPAALRAERASSSPSTAIAREPVTHAPPVESAAAAAVPVAAASAAAAAAATAAGDAPTLHPAPAWTRPTGADAAAAPRARRAAWPWVFGVVAALAAVAVFVALPRWVDEHGPLLTTAGGEPAGGTAAATTPAPPAAGARPGELPSDPAALAALARAKTAAEERRAEYARAAETLRAQRAEVWGGAPYARVAALGTAATRAYQTLDYAAAARDWAAGVALAAEVARARAPALAQALAAGRDGLARGDSRAAAAGFERALAIEPGLAEALRGRERAARLDELLALLDEGTVRERAGDDAGARERFRAALALDPQATAASAGLARLDARARAATLAAAIAQGQRALAAGRRDEARAALERARSLDPGAPAVADALAQLDANDRGARLSKLQAEAAAAERAERWADAVRAYDAALALDPTVRFAQDGRVRAAPRAELAARLDDWRRRPERLASADERAAAREALRAVAGLGDAVPALQREARTLEARVLAYETPVRVALASDNLTEVLVYRVGRLGAFESRELELLPGTYTIVGRRAGFRDVRRELVVAPGDGAAADIRCTEPI